jgi:hypothetical protein
MAEAGGAGEVDDARMLPLIWRVNSRLAVPEWRNWYTHQAQNLARFTPHVGSSPTSGTIDEPLSKMETAALESPLLRILADVYRDRVLPLTNWHAGLHKYESSLTRSESGHLSEDGRRFLLPQPSCL